MKESAPTGSGAQASADEPDQASEADGSNEAGGSNAADGPEQTDGAGGADAGGKTGGGRRATGSDAPGSAAAAAWVLRTLIMAGERHRIEVAGSFGLGATESQALGYVLLHGSRGQTELARDLGLASSGAVTALVDRLEQRGLVERTRHPTDRRRLEVRLTSRGEVVAVQSQALLREALDVIPADELPLLTSQLARLADRLQQQGRP